MSPRIVISSTNNQNRGEWYVGAVEALKDDESDQVIVVNDTNGRPLPEGVRAVTAETPAEMQEKLRQ